MNKYREMVHRHQQEINALPLGHAYSDHQFTEMMLNWSLDPEKDLDKICQFSYGAFCKKTDLQLIEDTFKRQGEELQEAISQDKTGEDFIYQMFLNELNNHEFGYTGDYEETLDAIGYTWDEVQSDKRLLHGFEKAAKKIMKTDIFE